MFHLSNFQNFIGTMDKKHTGLYNTSSMSTFIKHILSCYTLVAVFIATTLMHLVVPPLHSQDTRVFFREDFNNLENWRPLYFSKISRHSTYRIETNGSESLLRAESNASASALVYEKDFNVYDYPIARWRWKVNNIYRNTFPEKKSGDDYPIRVYITFKYEPETASALDKVKYGVAKRLYGEYPPHSTLAYVWANSEEQKTIITSPYTDKARLIALKKGSGKVGFWQNEEVNILRDYRIAFGSDPPMIASIAIMNDSDNSSQKSVSYLDFIEVFKNGD